MGTDVFPFVCYEVPEERMLCSPRIDHGAIDMRAVMDLTIRNDDFHLRYALAVMEMQRRTRYESSDGVSGYRVGGFAEMVKVRRDGIERRIVRHWPDRVGEKIAPSDGAISSSRIAEGAVSKKDVGINNSFGTVTSSFVEATSASLSGLFSGSYVLIQVFLRVTDAGDLPSTDEIAIGQIEVQIHRGSTELLLETIVFDSVDVSGGLGESFSHVPQVGLATLPFVDESPGENPSCNVRLRQAADADGPEVGRVQLILTAFQR